MRLWTFHPALLDDVALSALWRDLLKAQEIVLKHVVKRELVRIAPVGLNEFIHRDDGLPAIGSVMYAVYDESRKRDKAFNSTLIRSPRIESTVKIPVTADQVAYELALYREELTRRAPAKATALAVTIADWTGSIVSPAYHATNGGIHPDEDRPVDSRVLLAMLRKVQYFN